MAGLGRKDFQAGAVLSAADVDGYLMDQSVMKFANTAAAGSAYGTAIAEGMNFYLSDTDEVVFHNGTSFVKQDAGNNQVANGDLSEWSRGTYFTATWFNAGNLYSADRWQQVWDSFPTAATVSRQSFTPGTAPVAGYESSYFLRSLITTLGSNTIFGVRNVVDDVRTFAGQTATLSFWAKADSARTLNLEYNQNFGTGGSTGVTTNGGTFSLTTSWQRFTNKIALPSISGKTIGPGSHLRLNLLQASAAGSQLDIWGLQLEAGAVATPFKPAGGNTALDTVTAGSAGFDGVLVSTNSSTNPSGSGTPAWAGYDVAGKNKIINGGFDFWQRGTSPSFNALNSGNYQADRWVGLSDTGRTTTRQSSGISDIQYALRYQRTNGNTNTTSLDLYHMLDTPTSIPLAGKAVTLSLYARKGANYSGGNVTIGLDSGTGTDQNYIYPGFTGGASVTSSAVTLTTSWQRFSITGIVPSTATQLSVKILSGSLSGTAGAADYYEVTGVQLEAGSVATPFSRAGGTLQGELAACQRYYYRTSLDQSQAYGVVSATAWAENTATAVGSFVLPVSMRVAPTSIESANIAFRSYTTSSFALGALTMIFATTNNVLAYGSPGGLTAGQVGIFTRNNNTSGYVGFSAEL